MSAGRDYGQRRGKQQDSGRSASRTPQPEKAAQPVTAHAVPGQTQPPRQPPNTAQQQQPSAPRVSLENTADARTVPAPRRRQSNLPPRQLGLAAGLLVGLIILVLALVNRGGSDDTTNDRQALPVNNPTPLATPAVADTAVEQPKTKQQRRAEAKQAKEAERINQLPLQAPTDREFAFYEMLPESNIEPAQVDAYKSTPKSAKMKYSYLLQAGSFRDEADAKRMRAKLIMMDLPNVTINRTTGSNGVWFRVRVGPFDNRSRMNKAHDKLVRQWIQPMEIKLKQ